MNPALRILINFLIVSVFVLLYKNLGWISFDHPPMLIEYDFANQLLVAGTIGILMLLVGEILDLVYKVFKIATLGLGKMIYPIYFVFGGYLKLFLPSLILVGWYSHTYNILAVIVISLTLGLFRIPPSKDKDE